MAIILNRGHPQLHGCVGWWPMLSAAGRDLIGTNHATTSQTITSSGRNDLGIAYQMDATASNMQCGAAAGAIAGSSTELTVIAWMKPSGSDDDFSRIIQRALGGSGTNGFSMHRGTGGALDVVHLSVDNSNSSASSSIFTNDVWQHIALTWRSATNGTDLYKDGVLVENLNWHSSGTIPASTAVVSIGAWDTDATRSAAGQFADVRVYFRKLSTPEIQGIYVNSWTPFYAQTPIFFGAAAAAGWSKKINTVTTYTKINTITSATGITKVNTVAA